MTNFSFAQICLVGLAIIGCIFFQNRKWWLIGALIPLGLFAIEQYLGLALLGETGAWHVLKPNNGRPDIAVELYIFTIEMPLWSICIGLATLILEHVSTDSFIGKVQAVVLVIIPLLILLWLFTFFLEVGLDAT